MFVSSSDKLLSGGAPAKRIRSGCRKAETLGGDPEV